MSKNFRNEAEVFSKLETLCQSKGYAHVISYLCWKNNVIGFDKTTEPSSLLNPFSNRLIRTELTTLIGLLVKSEIDLTYPHPNKMQSMIDESQELLFELHKKLAEPIQLSSIEDIKDENPFKTGAAFREPIFYAAESAYSFQYRDISQQKYQSDQNWLTTNKGFTSKQVATFIEAARKCYAEKLEKQSKQLHKKRKAYDWSQFVRPNIFTIEEMVSATNLHNNIVENIFVAFSLLPAPTNNNFNSIDDFNEVNEKPFIPIGQKEYILFQLYNLYESAYESPYFWMIKDKNYESQAGTNRGNFTENYCFDRLQKVFPKENVYKNVKIYQGTKDEVGEIDVLVEFAGKIIIFQTKSKRLTISARKGNDQAIRNDFKLAIQHAYDQALLCARALKQEHELVASNGLKFKLESEIKDIYLITVLCDHYPSLSFQAEEFLNTNLEDKIHKPLVTDIFHIDVLCEFLENPIYFLDFLHRRLVNLKTLASNELPILSAYLQSGLPFCKDITEYMIFPDELAHDIDISLAVRREGISGKNSPDGLLTRLKGSPLNELIDYIGCTKEKDLYDLGFLLLSLSDEGASAVKSAIDHMIFLTRKDKKLHDVTFPLSDMGLTVHISPNSTDIVYEKLGAHCALRKYKMKADQWFGLLINPFLEPMIQGGITLKDKWKHSSILEKASADFMGAKSQDPKTLTFKRQKIGVNEKCPCGSNIKYKKCHGKKI
jgi:SEC-C motif/Nuclease-related domain